MQESPFFVVTDHYIGLGVSHAVKQCEGGGCLCSCIAPWGLALRLWESRNGTYPMGWLLVFCRDPLSVLCQLPVGRCSWEQPSTCKPRLSGASVHGVLQLC